VKSRYVASLEAKRASSNSPIEAALLDLDIAGYSARKGISHEAEAIVSSVRSQEWSRTSPRLVAKLNFVEGLLSHCAGLDEDALVKWRRANAIASTEDCIDILATVAGWLAFLHYTNGRFESMAKELDRCLEYWRLSPANGALTPRARMVVALVLHTCRRTQEALAWYEDSRGSILSVGDDVELAALVHNMAWIRVYNHRNARLRGEPVPSSEADVLRVSSEAVQSYEELVGLASFPAMTPLLQAQNFILSENFSPALSILDEHAKHVRQQGLGRLAPNFDADRAYCLARLGKLKNPAESLESIEKSVDSSVHVDDLGVLYSRLRDCAELANLDEMRARFDDEAWKNWRAFDSLISELLRGISGFLPGDPQHGDSAPRP